MKNAFFILVFLLPISSNILKKDFILSKTQDNYYYHINKAILAIVNGNYLESSNHFKLAYKNENIGFSEDYYNSLNLAQFLNDTSLAYYSAFKLANMNICRNFFNNYEILKKDTLKMTLLKEKIEIGSRKIDYNYLNELIKLKEIDQEVREYYSENLSFEEGKIKKRKKDIADSLNFIRFNNLVEEKGFPSENMIGIECSMDNKGISPPLYNILLVHFSLKKYDGIFELLRNNFLDNKLSNFQYAYYFDKGHSHSYYWASPIWKIGNSYYVHNFSKEQLLKINKLRKKIDLISVENQIKIFQYIKKDTPIKIKYKLLHIPFFPKDFFSKEKLERNFVLIEGL